MAVNIVTRVKGRVAIRRAILSVSDKTGLESLVKDLSRVCPGIEFWSTGGTYSSLETALGKGSAALHSVSGYTGQPEMQGGLVKTLDFKIYLGLLGEEFNPAHETDLRRTGAVKFDLVAVNLYPFSATVAASGATPEAARANIDIGGPCMIRAAAKNFHRVAVVVDPSDYPALISRLENGRGSLGLEDRFDFARKAFAHTAAYDAAISAYLSKLGHGDVKGCYEIA